MLDIKARIATLENWALQAAAERARHALFCVIRISSFMLDTASVLYYDRGLYETPRRTNAMTIAEALGQAQEWGGGPIRCDMTFCGEWLYALCQEDDLYSKAQKARIKREFASRWPGVATLIETCECEEVVSALAELPQSFMLGGKFYEQTAKNR